MTARPATAREVALQVCRDVFGPNPRRAREALDYRLRKTELEPRDRAFATELAYGAIKMRRYLDFELAPYLGERAKTLPQPIAEIARLGTYQLRVMRGVEAYAAVSESVGLARKYGHKGTAGLINAVLRRIAADPPRDADLATRASLPSWIVDHWRERFGVDRLNGIVAGVNAPSPAGACVDLRVITREDASRALAENGIAALRRAPSRATCSSSTRPRPPTSSASRSTAGTGTPSRRRSPSTCSIRVRGCASSTSAAAAATRRCRSRAARATKARCSPSTTIARKTAHTAARLEAAGIASVALVTADVTAMEAAPDADAVLLDAPCSGLGILGRQPEARWRKRPDDPQRMASVQRRLIDSAARSVRPGGTFVYAVCSTDRRESEDVVDAFLAAHEQFARAPIPQRYAPFATPFGDLLVPPGIDGRDGFYVAKMQRA